MIVIDRKRCVGCGKCATLRMVLYCLTDSDDVEMYQDPEPQYEEFVHNVIKECWAGCVYLYKDN